MRLQVQDDPRAGEPLFLGTTLVFAGNEPGVQVSSSGQGPISYSVRQADGHLRTEAVIPGDCVPHDMTAGTLYWFPYAESGAFVPGDPDAAFYEQFFATPDLVLPSGNWVVEARLDLYDGGDCGSSSTDATVEIPITVR